jgi:hypothetical protein
MTSTEIPIRPARTPLVLPQHLNSKEGQQRQNYGIRLILEVKTGRMALHRSFVLAHPGANAQAIYLHLAIILRQYSGRWFHNLPNKDICTICIKGTGRGAGRHNDMVRHPIQPPPCPSSPSLSHISKYFLPTVGRDTNASRWGRN